MFAAAFFYLLIFIILLSFSLNHFLQENFFAVFCLSFHSMLLKVIEALVEMHFDIVNMFLLLLKEFTHFVPFVLHLLHAFNISIISLILMLKEFQGLQYNVCQNENYLFIYWLVNLWGKYPPNCIELLSWHMSETWK